MFLEKDNKKDNIKNTLPVFAAIRDMSKGDNEPIVKIPFPIGHLVVFGITGSGKTESVLLPLWINKTNVTVVDGKGDENAKMVARIFKPEANFYNIKSKINPLKGLKKDEILELLKNSLYPKTISTEETFYQNFAIQALSFAIDYIENITFEKLFLALFRERMKNLYATYKSYLSEPEELILSGIVNNSDYASLISNFLNKLQPFALAKNLNYEDAENIDIKADNWFSLRNIESENAFGRMLIEYIRLVKPRQRDFTMTFAIDEFSDLMFSYFSKIIKEIRGFGIEIILLTQSFSDADRFDPTLLDIILNNARNKIIFAQDGLRNEDISRLFGYKVEELKSRTMETHGTTMVSSGQTKDWLVQPSAISALRPGNAIGKLLINNDLTKVLMQFQHIDMEAVLKNV
ncbi:MAG: type IV secretory system conjugative DNA transfer family protein [bacterium]